MIRDVPVCERPRERLLKEGSDALSNQELIAVILGSGTKQESVLQLSQQILHDFNGLRLLKDSTVEELKKKYNNEDMEEIFISLVGDKDE